MQNDLMYGNADAAAELLAIANHVEKQDLSAALVNALTRIHHLQIHCEQLNRRLERLEMNAEEA